ncbi:TPA: armadillo/beta-catenin-like repeat-containing protein, partial [Klebsiella variicola subsp. variicola]
MVVRRGSGFVPDSRVLPVLAQLLSSKEVEIKKQAVFLLSEFTIFSL